MVEERDIDIRKKLIEDYMAKCPFIEMHRVLTIEREGATIDILEVDDKHLRPELEEFKQEIVHNIGANTLHDHNN